jgi:preprotein translocase subunit SecG
MGILEIFFLVLIILAAIVLTFFIMIQDDTGEGMGGIFGGASTTPFGSRAGNVLTRITSIIAVIFLVSTIAYAFLKRTPTDSTDILGKAREKQYENAATKPWFIDLPKESETSGTTTSVDQSGNLLLQGNSGTSNSGTTVNTDVNVTTSTTTTTGSTGNSNTTSTNK